MTDEVSEWSFFFVSKLSHDHFLEMKTEIFQVQTASCCWILIQSWCECFAPSVQHEQELFEHIEVYFSLSRRFKLNAFIWILDERNQDF